MRQRRDQHHADREQRGKDGPHAGVLGHIAGPVQRFGQGDREQSDNQRADEHRQDLNAAQSRRNAPAIPSRIEWLIASPNKLMRRNSR